MKKQFNPFTGTLDIVGTDEATATLENFSLKKIQTGESKTVPSTQEMLLKSLMTVNGILHINGTVRFIKDNCNQMAFFNKINVDEVVFVPQNRSMMFKRVLTVNGILRTQGMVEVVT